MHDPNYILANTSHRPWPVPKGPWAINMTWRNLLFAHWRVPAQQLRPHIPEPLVLDEFDGSAWLAVTPFVMDLRLRGISVLRNTPELNVRTYVRYEDKPGVFFFSLDLASALGVWGARVGFGLPYWKATMQARISRRMQTGDADEWIAFQSQRVTKPAEFRGKYRHRGQPSAPSAGSLEYFLTERYCLYNVEKGKVYRAEIAHLPWPLQLAEAELERNTMPEAAGIGLTNGTKPVLHFARELDVLCWKPKRVS